MKDSRKIAHTFSKPNYWLKRSRLINLILEIASPDKSGSQMASCARMVYQTMRSLLICNVIKIASSIRVLKNSTFLGSSQRQLVLIFGALMFFSCGPESLPISVEPAESKIAVASLVGPDDFVFVSLTKSFSALSAESISEISDDFTEALLIDSALVTLSYAGVTDTLESLFGISGLYFTELQTFNEFQLMELSVYDSTTSETATAQSILQPPVSVDSVVITRRDTTINFLADLSFAFDDPPNQDNFYVMQVYQFTPPDSVASDTLDDNSFYFGDENFLIYERIFTDRGVDNDGRIRRNDLIDFTSTIDSALVVLTNIEEGYYNFLEARGRSGGILSSLANETG